MHQGTIVQTTPASIKLTELLPNDSARGTNETLDVSALKTGKYTIGLRVPNPMPGGFPVRFANPNARRRRTWMAFAGDD